MQLRIRLSPLGALLNLIKYESPDFIFISEIKVSHFSVIISLYTPRYNTASDPFASCLSVLQNSSFTYFPNYYKLMARKEIF